ncbi:hypothetical protein, partial [Mycobacterium avium]
DVAQLGGANRYTLIPPEERVERWNDARRQWESICRKWENWKFDCGRWLEKEAQYLWLDAEARAKDEFTMPIFEAASRRACENGVTDQYGFAIHMAERWWDWKVRLKCPGSPKIVEGLNAATDEQIVELATRQGYHTPAPRCTECAAELPADRADLAVCIDCAWTVAEIHQADNMSAQADKINPLGGQDRPPRRTESVPQADKVDTLNCENSDSTSPSRTVKVRQSPVAGALGRAPAQEIPSPQPVAGGQSRAGVDGCRLCNDAGEALALDGGRVIMLTPSVESEDWDKEYPLICRHSLGANYTEIKRTMRETGLCPNFTGYGEDIDGPDEYAEDDCISLSRRHVPTGWGE